MSYVNINSCQSKQLRKKFNFGVLLFLHSDVYIRVLVSLLYNDVMEIFNIGTTVCTLAIIMKKKKRGREFARYIYHYYAEYVFIPSP